MEFIPPGRMVSHNWSIGPSSIWMPKFCKFWLSKLPPLDLGTFLQTRGDCPWTVVYNNPGSRWGCQGILMHSVCWPMPGMSGININRKPDWFCTKTICVWHMVYKLCWFRNMKGNRSFCDLRYGEEDGISPSTTISIHPSRYYRV